MKIWIVEYQDAGSNRWVSVGRFRARTAAGALQQFARDLRHFPNVQAIRAVPA